MPTVRHPFAALPAGRVPTRRAPAVRAPAGLVLGSVLLTGCAVPAPAAGALPRAAAGATAISPVSPIASTASTTMPSAPRVPASARGADLLAGADLADGAGTAVASVAALGPWPAPTAPTTTSQRARGAFAAVLAYFASVVELRRSGREEAFLATTTERCGCRSLRAEAMARAGAGGVPGFDVRVVRAVEVDPVDLLRTVIEVDVVIPAHIDPAAPGLPREAVGEARPHLAVLVDFRGGTGRVDAVLRRAGAGGTP